MTQTMKPRKIFTAATKGLVSEINVGGEWYAITWRSLTLIGTREWTIRNNDGVVLTRCSGNDSFEVR